jgi:hypothetical protein
MTLIPPRTKTRWEQFLLLLIGIGCGAFAGVYWFVAGAQCKTWQKVFGIVLVLGVSLGAVLAAAKWVVGR